MKRLACLASLCLLISLEAGAGEEHIISLVGNEFATPEEARAAWKPIEGQTPPPDAGVIEGHRCLKLPCNFKGNDQWRVAWDHSGHWDLSACQTITLDALADQDRPASMTVYFHSGAGWYGCGFAVPPGRESIVLSRKNFHIEDHPSGWDKIDVIRLAVINDKSGDRAIPVAQISGIARPAQVAVYQNADGIRAEGGIPEFVRQAGDALERLGVPYEIIGDAEVAEGKLKGKKLAFLPLNPVLSQVPAAALERFVGEGGKLLCCYALPPPLDKLLGVTSRGMLRGSDTLYAFAFHPAGAGPEIKVIQESWLARQLTAGAGTQARAFWTNRQGQLSTEPAVTRNANGFFIGHVLTAQDQAAKDRLLLVMLGELWPELWQEAYAGQRKRLGVLAGFKDLAQVLEAVRASTARGEKKTQIDELLKSFEALRQAAESRAGAGDFAAATDLLGRAQDTLRRAYATGLPSQAGEFRGVWCHSPAGVAGMNWDQAVKRLSDAGFNALIVNMLWGGSTSGTSQVLPRGQNTGRDLLAECAAAGKKYGLAVHVWKVDWNLGSNTPEPFLQELRQAGRLQADRAGKTLNWLCPSHPENQKLELESLLEIARNYDVAGIHLDYIRYPGPESCYCAGCRERFEASLKITVQNWPRDVIDGPQSESYRQFRRDNITRLVAAVSAGARKIRPDIKISAAVFPNWASARDQEGQDWKLWIEQGYLDFVCPMQYTDSAAMFEAMNGQCRKWVAGRIPLVPGIGATLGQSPDQTLQQVLIARSQKCAGFVLFNYEAQLSAALELLQLGATAEKTEPK